MKSVPVMAEVPAGGFLGGKMNRRRYGYIGGDSEYCIKACLFETGFESHSRRCRKRGAGMTRSC